MINFLLYKVRFRFFGRSFVVIGTAVFVPVIASAAVLDVSSADVVTGEMVWRGIQATGGGYLTDSGGTGGGGLVGIDDQQTGQQVSDLVGTTTAPTLYIGYGEKSAVDSTLMIGFRVRLNGYSVDNKGVADPVALKQVTYVGFDFGNTTTGSSTPDGVVDMFVGADFKNQPSSSNFWYNVIVDAGTVTTTNTNTSPSTTTLVYSGTGTAGGALYSYVTDGADSLSNYQQVTSANSIVGGVTTISGNADAFLTFAVPFADFVAAVKSTSVMGSLFNFDENSSFSVTAATSNTYNTINQDAMSAMGVSFNFSAPISATIPVPEFSTWLELGGLLMPFCGLRRICSRRRTCRG